MAEAVSRLPDADYFIAASRLHPDLDGGYTVATLQRAQQFAEFGGVDPTLLTFDLAPSDGDLERFRDLGLADDSTRLRNLFAELRARPSLLRTAALHPRDPSQESIGSTDVVDDDGTPLLRLPYIARPDWHRSDADILVFAPDGRVLGALHGFGELYRLWVDAVVAESGDRPVVVVCEARQLGELLVGADRSYGLIHTVHNAHTEPPYTWDAPLAPLWSDWFETIDRYDGVIWLTEAQRSDARRRFGDHPGWIVVPHPAQLPSSPHELAHRDPLRAVMLARLAPQKRVDDAVRAWKSVSERVPGARLEIFGDGPERGALESLIDELGLHGSVVLKGHVGRAADSVAGAGLLVMTSRYEGQSLAITEALAAGTPVVAYDVPYGPAELVTQGVSGVLVPSGDVAALADEISGILGDPPTIARYSAGALAWASTHTPENAISATATLVAEILERRTRLLSTHMER